MATYAETTNCTIKQAFTDFDLANPHVYQTMRALALSAINNGKRKISFKLILNVVRWEQYMQTNDTTCSFKINDAYSAHYARKFAAEFPTYTDHIEFRALRSA
jgi:hypothetical protein